MPVLFLYYFRSSIPIFDDHLSTPYGNVFTRRIKMINKIGKICICSEIGLELVFAEKIALSQSTYISQCTQCIATIEIWVVFPEISAD